MRLQPILVKVPQVISNVQPKLRVTAQELMEICPPYSQKMKEPCNTPRYFTSDTFFKTEFNPRERTKLPLRIRVFPKN